MTACRFLISRRVFLWAALAALLLAFQSSEAKAQIPDEFTNLQVLHEDVSKAELVGMMRRFAGALGARCNHCHVGENPDNLQGYDFASDEKETKRIARLMMKMVNDINGNHLAGLPRSETLQVQCSTCHGGLKRPQPLRELLMATLEEDGVEAAIAQYRSLREEHYGRAAYDFGAGTLNSITENLARNKRDFEAAEAIIRLNLEFNADRAYPHFLLTQVLMAKGDREGAIASIKRALEIDPDSQFLQNTLKRLEGQQQ